MSGFHDEHSLGFGMDDCWIIQRGRGVPFSGLGRRAGFFFFDSISFDDSVDTVAKTQEELRAFDELLRELGRDASEPLVIRFEDEIENPQQMS